MTEPEDPPNDGVSEPRKTPGGPYFGRLLIVLFAAIAFCGFMTWLLEKLVAD
jgi:flagellar biogenesis protein FliO